MEIREFIHIIKKWWIMIALIALASVLSTGFVSYFLLQNIYESSAVMIIASSEGAQAQTNLTLNDYTLNTKLVNSYKVLCKTDRVLSQVMAETKLPMTVKELSKEINVTADVDTEIIRIVVQDKDPNTAALIANAVATVFIREIPQIMSMDNMQIIDRALPNPVPVKPNKMMNTVVFGLLGTLVGIGIAFLIEYFDVSIKSSEQLTELANAPVIGIIPHMVETRLGMHSEKKSDNTYGMSIAHARESFGKVKVNLEFLSAGNHYKCILLSSSVAGEGKSTVTANLAVSLSASRCKTLLIDADLRHPTQHRLFNVSNRVGLSEIVANNLDWKKYVNKTKIPNLFVISAGWTPPNPSELLGSNRMGDILAEIKRDFEFVLIDSSPILLVPDPISLCKHVDGVVLVARYNFTNRQAVLNTRDALKLANKSIIGAILNCVSRADRIFEYGERYGYKHMYLRDDLQRSAKLRASR